MVNNEKVETAEKSGKEIVVDIDTCIGCGTCEEIAPEYFKVVGGVSTVIKQYDESDADKIRDAVDDCPVQAISIQ